MIVFILFALVFRFHFFYMSRLGSSSVLAMLELEELLQANISVDLTVSDQRRSRIINEISQSNCNDD